ncbi:hypothetical protein CC2G_004774 [Coprinopsis cinerea AmutBmut pab1-1]|nr:hypothetical protein CC2G_004774 [Coprinopsis cinerea AmutBmut pab1-1]
MLRRAVPFTRVNGPHLTFSSSRGAAGYTQQAACARRSLLLSPRTNSPRKSLKRLCPAQTFQFREYSTPVEHPEQPPEENTSKKPPKVKGKYKWLSRQISTLNPSKLLPEDYVDASGGRVAFTVMAPEGGKRRISFTRKGQQFIPFPSNARGFFYFHRPDQSCITSGLRFRVVDKPDPALFSQGEDLMKPDGGVWVLPLTAIIKGRIYLPFRELIIRDELITPAEVAWVESLEVKDTRAGLITIASMTQPFECDFPRTGFCIRVQEGEELYDFNIQGPASFGFTGSIQVRFELAYRQDPVVPPKPFVVLRLLKFLVPPTGDEPVKQEEGKLVRALSLSRAGGSYIWTISPSTLPSPCVEALERAYPPHPSRLYERAMRKGQRLSLEPVGNESF